MTNSFDQVVQKGAELFRLSRDQNFTGLYFLEDAQSLPEAKAEDTESDASMENGEAEMSEVEGSNEVKEETSPKAPSDSTEKQLPAGKRQIGNLLDTLLYDKLNGCRWAASLCKDYGSKQHNQGQVLVLINALLGCKTMKQLLERGWIHVNGFFLYCVAFTGRLLMDHEGWFRDCLRST